ncbi:glucuronyl esterase domain-containing protein [Rhodopirellula sp. P2]|uniref:glucuronyl esterase domain-containing protein n=1 Tax=Rhodopirellula sp. P2 TaxID=2127060 RepID=UPI00236832B6|nr:acetylxylan esterase [Rhodopirellula sp. P2]WDQ15324.1 acetylxylan esterase [Rhodopirellula sp. P2]
MHTPFHGVLFLTGTVFLMTFTATGDSQAQPPKKFVANYDESKIPSYELPPALKFQNGDSVTTAEEWGKRRAETLRLFEEHVFGIMPEHRRIQVKLVRSDKDFRPGVTRHELDVSILPLDASSEIAPLVVQVLADVPQSATPVPAILGLNFQGNHTVDADPKLRIPTSWVRDRRDGSTDGNKPTEKGRGVASSRWPSSTITDRGYALITVYYGDIDPDFDDGFKNGVHGLMPAFIESLPAEHRPGSIAGWAYGLSCVLDAIEQTETLNVDAARVGVLGHSRLGKTSLWAGATDPRFAMVISNDSGCGGAALSRRAIGETVGRINTSFPHWFCDAYLQYNENESASPVDQHQLIALSAPRAIAVGSATEDEWADPKGEFLAWQAAAPVYQLLGMSAENAKVVRDASMLSGQAVLNAGPMQYHLREGKHDLADYDWKCYLDLADRALHSKSP